MVQVNCARVNEFKNEDPKPSKEEILAKLKADPVWNGDVIINSLGNQLSEMLDWNVGFEPETIACIQNKLECNNNYLEEPDSIPMSSYVRRIYWDDIKDFRYWENDNSLWILDANGTQHYYQDGLLHHEYGPAVQFKSHSKLHSELQVNDMYFLEGEEYETEELYKRALKMYKQKENFKNY